MAKQKKRIAKPWISILEIAYGNCIITIHGMDTVTINLVNQETGEIRQKKVTIDQIVRRIFEFEIVTSKDIELEDIK